MEDIRKDIVTTLLRKIVMISRLRLPKTRAFKIVLFKHYVTDAPI
ncbi:MAG: hypothetical protein N2517_08260 [Ignavibacteria bacterium]|nr:hypothetical protein [Ignavibacteria bacterium]